MSMNNKNIFNSKGLKSLRSSLRNMSTSAEAALWEKMKTGINTWRALDSL